VYREYKRSSPLVRAPGLCRKARRGGHLRPKMGGSDMDKHDIPEMIVLLSFIVVVGAAVIAAVIALAS